LDLELFMDHSASYTRTAVGLHWLVALAIITTFSVGLYMSDLPLSPEKLKIYSWHKWAGVTIFLLVAFRLMWRLTHRPPALPAGMAGWQRQAAALTHWLLYALMIAVPISGWLMSSAKGFQTVYFGVIPLPDLLAKNKPLGETLETVHQTLNYTMAGVVGLHALAALKHHLIDRDEVLARMLPFIRKP
jgi:cytochrome b561